MGRLLSTAGPLLVASLPWAVMAQNAVNTARVAAPAGTYEANVANNEAVDNDAQLAVVIAIADNAGPVNGAVGATNALNAFTGDTLNGLTATAANATVALAPGATVPAGLTFDPATGNTSVAPGIPGGVYSFDYQLCEKLNPNNCAIATESVTVVAAPIAAVSDSVAGINGATGAANVLNAFSGDTLNGVAADATNATIVLAPGASVPAGLTFDPATGNTSVAAGTPAGVYSFDYRLCEKLNPDNCAIATETVTVIAAPIAAINDSITGINGATGAANVLNAFTGDTLNGVAATAANATVALAPGATIPAGLTFDPVSGNTSVAPGTPAGVYSFDYRLCEKLNPSNCVIATESVTVVPARSDLSGIVFDDANIDGAHQPGEALRAGWIVEVIRNGEVIATTTTDANGAYSVTGLLSGPGYSILFRNPENSVVYGAIPNLVLANNASLPNQNLPIDPSGVIYNSVSRAPVAGARVMLTDSSGTALPVSCFIDPSQANQVTGISGNYRFDIVIGAAAECPTGRTEYRILVTPPMGFAAPVSTVLPVQSGPFRPSPTGARVPIVPQPTAPQGNEPTIYYLAFSLAQGDGEVVHNHIPLDPFLTRAPLIVTKTSVRRSASVGELVPYTIVVRNSEAVQRANVDVVDIVPPGFKYVPGSASINDVAGEPQANDRELTWSRQTLPANGAVTYRLTLVVGAGVTGGDRINNGLARNPANGAEISNRGQAVVSIVSSSLFDCAEVIGKVFDDRDGNGYQDKGEPGIAGARLATVNGLLVTTDEFGRYHITCAAVPDARIGSNFVLKVDPRTLPAGYVPTSDNPQSVRLTRGKVVELNFGASQRQTVEIAVDHRAFAASGQQLRPDFAGQLVDLASRSEAGNLTGRDGSDARLPSGLVVRIVYTAAPGETPAETEAHLTALKAAILAAFNAHGKAQPPLIETSLRRAPGAAGQE